MVKCRPTKHEHCTWTLECREWTNLQLDLAIQQIRFDHRDVEIGRGALKCAPGRGRGGGRAGDLPRGAVIAVSQHLNEGRIERSHGHAGEGRGGRGAALPPIPELPSLSQPLPPSNSIQERRSRTMNTSQLLLKEEEAASERNWPHTKEGAGSGSGVCI